MDHREKLERYHRIAEECDAAFSDERMNRLRANTHNTGASFAGLRTFLGMPYQPSLAGIDIALHYRASAAAACSAPWKVVSGAVRYAVRDGLGFGGVAESCVTVGVGGATVELIGSPFDTSLRARPVAVAALRHSRGSVALRDGDPSPSQRQGTAIAIWVKRTDTGIQKYR